MTARDTAASAPVSAVADMASSIAQMQLAALTPMSWLGPAWMGAMQTSVQETSDFVLKRLQKDMETQKALLECETFADVQRVQSAALQQAIDDYRDEADRLAAIARDFMEQATGMATAASGGKTAARG